MEDLMLGIGTNCLTAAFILWETTDLQSRNRNRIMYSWDGFRKSRNPER